MKQFTQNKVLVLLVAILLVANLCLMLYFLCSKAVMNQKDRAVYQILCKGNWA